MTAADYVVVGGRVVPGSVPLPPGSVVPGSVVRGTVVPGKVVATRTVLEDVVLPATVLALAALAGSSAPIPTPSDTLATASARLIVRNFMVSPSVVGRHCFQLFVELLDASKGIRADVIRR